MIPRQNRNQSKDGVTQRFYIVQMGSLLPVPLHQLFGVFEQTPLGEWRKRVIVAQKLKGGFAGHLAADQTV